MKKPIRVSLLVLAAVALISFVGCKNDSEPEPESTPSKFVGEWRSTDGGLDVTVTSDKFESKVQGMNQPFSGSYAVSSDGKTLTSQIEVEGNKMSFTMTLKDGESDVLTLPLPAELGGETYTLVKKSTTKPNLTGTWTGKVASAGNADATINFADNKATLTVTEQSVDSTVVTQDGNFFTVTWAGNALGLNESTGMISASGKAWLDDGSVFTKQK